MSSPIVVCTWDAGIVGSMPWCDLCLGPRMAWPDGPETFLVCTTVLVSLLGIFAGPLVPVLLSGIASVAIACAWQWAGLMFGIETGCGVLRFLGLAHFWGSPLELVPVPDLACAPEEWVEVDCYVLSPLEAAGPSGAIAIFPPLDNSGADVSILVLLICVGYLSLLNLYRCRAVL